MIFSFYSLALFLFLVLSVFLSLFKIVSFTCAFVRMKLEIGKFWKRLLARNMTGSFGLRWRPGGVNQACRPGHPREGAAGPQSARRGARRWNPRAGSGSAGCRESCPPRARWSCGSLAPSRRRRCPDRGWAHLSCRLRRASRHRPGPAPLPPSWTRACGGYSGHTAMAASASFAPLVSIKFPVLASCWESLSARNSP